MSSSRRNKDSEFPLISSNYAFPVDIDGDNGRSNKKKKEKKKKKEEKKGFASVALRGFGCRSSDAYAPPAAVTVGSPSRRRNMRRVDDDDIADANADNWRPPRFADDDRHPRYHHNHNHNHHHSLVMTAGAVRHDAETVHREIMKFQTRMSGGLNIYDRYRDMRLDVDRMSYEELLELGDRIGYVSTGLREDEISRSLRKMKHYVSDSSHPCFSAERERKCSICQEEYEVNEDIGKLKCGHSYHIFCIRQWLLQKNACPVCKTAVTKTRCTLIHNGEM